jgi:predicted alpha/beta-fold hydrolase
MKKMAQLKEYVNQNANELVNDLQKEVSLWTTNNNYVVNVLGYDNEEDYFSLCKYNITHRLMEWFKLRDDDDKIIDEVYNVVSSLVI